MVYILAVMFATSIGWLTSFIWSDFVLFALGPGVVGEVQAHPVASEIVSTSHIIVSLLVALVAVAPAVRVGDAVGGVLSGAALGASIGAVLTCLVWSISGPVPYAMVGLIVMGASGLTTILAALTYCATDLLLGEVPSSKAAERREVPDLQNANAAYQGMQRADLSALPFHPILVKPVSPAPARRAA